MTLAPIESRRLDLWMARRTHNFPRKPLIEVESSRPMVFHPTVSLLEQLFLHFSALAYSSSFAEVVSADGISTTLIVPSIAGIPTGRFAAALIA